MLAVMDQEFRCRKKVLSDSEMNDILAIIYSASALLMIVNSFSQQRRVMSGSILLFISGLLVMYNEIQGKTFFSHLISLGTYYVAIALLASSCTRVPLAKLVPQMPETGEMEV